MMGGQVIDIESEGMKISDDRLINLQRLKTGALIECACVMGCMMAGADENAVGAAKLYAKNLGLAFQIKDDILDIEGDQNILGKPVGSDENNQKSTFVSIFGMDKAKEMVKSLTNEAIRAAYTLNEPEFLIYLANVLVNRNK
ncbi:Farnesyl diphosphate synthase [bioreactor metagenome]|uniref:Farnesyl diphosphate synthase n=1 Tax=bioreactor metagenome TaxID=1076179 RepID=A0A645EG14_9ZZZZ